MRLQFEIKKRHFYILALVVAIMGIGMVWATYISRNPGHTYDQLDLGTLTIRTGSVDVDGELTAGSVEIRGDSLVDGDMTLTGELTAENMTEDSGRWCGLELAYSSGFLGIGDPGHTHTVSMPCIDTDLDPDLDDFTLHCPDGYAGMGMDFDDKGNRYLFTCVKI